MKSLVINGKVMAAGHPDALLRVVNRISRKKKLEKSSIRIINKIIFKLEEAI